MKKLNQSILSMVVLAALLLTVACGPTGKRAELTEKGKLLTSIKWKLDPGATFEGVAKVLKDSAGIALKDSLGITGSAAIKENLNKVTDMVSPVMVFGIDDKDQSKLSYTSSVGVGFLSVSVKGYWNFNADESEITMTEIDKDTKKEKSPVTYKILELSTKKLVLQEGGNSVPVIYTPAK